MMEEVPHVQTWYETISTYWGWIVGFLAAVGFIWKATRNTKKEAKPIFQAIKRFIDVTTAVQVLTDTVNKRFDTLDGNRKADLALIESLSSENFFLQEQINSLTDIMQTPQWKADDKGNCIDANEAFCDLVGRTFEELEGDGWATIFPQNMRQSDMAAWDHSVSKKSKLFRVVYIKTSNEKLTKVKLRAIPIFDKAGVFKVYLCSLVVIGEV